MLLVLAGCGTVRPGSSAVASSQEAAARSASALPGVTYGLRVTSPGEGEGQSMIPWIEIKGRTGRAELFEADLVIAVDLSLSTMFPSGVDLDQDGVIGQLRGSVKGSRVDRGASARVSGRGGELAHLGGAVMRSGNAWRMNPRNWTTDKDDTIAQAQLEAARILIAGLGSRRNRIGLVTYTTRARVRSDVGSPARALGKVEKVRVTGASPDTNLAAALRQARLMLSRDRADDDRQRAVLLFTDGRPNFPVDEYLARIQALYAADDLVEADIDLYVFIFGNIGLDQARLVLELAGSGEGRLFRVMHPRRLLEDLPPVDLAPRWLKIRNATTGAEGEAVRAFSDGRFDAFVPLVPGENRIRVLAVLGDGRLQRWEQDVHYQPPEVPGEEQRRAEERVLRELDARAAGSGSEPLSELPR